MTERSSGSAAVAAEPPPASGAGDLRDEGRTRRRTGRFAQLSSRFAFGGLVVLFVVLSLFSTLGSQPGRYIPDAHIEDSLAPAENLSRQAFLWDDSKSLGKPRKDFTPVTAAVEAGLSAVGVTGWAIERLMSALYISLAAIGVILLLREFLPRVGPAHALAAFVYAFSPYTAQALLFAPLFLAYALAPWFAWFALRGMRDGDPWRWAAAFALAVAAVGTWNVAALGYALLPAGLVGLYLVLHERWGFAALWAWAWRAGLLSVLICLPALIVLIGSRADISANLRTTELPETVARAATWSETWRGLGDWVTYFFGLGGGLKTPQASSYFTAPDVILATFVASVGALIALALSRWRHRLLFGLMLLVSLVIMVGIREDASPFGWLLSLAFDHSEFAKGFRATYKAGPGLMLAIAILLGVGVAAAVRVARSTGGSDSHGFSRGRLRQVTLGVLLPVIVAEGVLVASYPFWTGQLYSDDTGFKGLPSYWEETFDYLESEERPGRVLMLPGADDARYRWGSVQENLFDAFSSLTPVVNRPLPQGTAESADLVTALNEYVNSPGYVKGTLGPILKRLGVRWVLLQNDFDWQSMRFPRPSTYDALREDPGLKLAAAFGRPGENTFAAGDLSAGGLGETSLAPVELYEVNGDPSPLPTLQGGPPLLVAGGGDSWPALAAAGLLDGPPVAYTGAAADEDLTRMVASGAGVVVTDGNRKRSTATTNETLHRSPTLAQGEPTERAPGDLFGRERTQSLATYADAAWISASRYGFSLSTYQPALRPASAFDGVERTAWMVRGPLDPDGETLTAQFREPTRVTAVSVLPRDVGQWRVRAVDVVLRTEDGQTSRRLRFTRRQAEPTLVRLDAVGVTSIELRLADVAGPGPIGLSGGGIAEVAVFTPAGPLDLREFVRTPDDLANRAARDPALAAELAARPPRYELRRLTGPPGQQEETELRREITTFGTHRYRLSATARLDPGAVDAAIGGVLGNSVGALGSPGLGGRPDSRGPLAVDDDLSTGWQPAPAGRPRLDVRLPSQRVRTVEVFVLSGPPRNVNRSRVTGVEIEVGEGGARARSELGTRQRCLPVDSVARGCLERHVAHVTPTQADNVSVTLTEIERVSKGSPVPEVVEVRVNGRDWPAISDSKTERSCAPLFAVDGRPVYLKLPRPKAALSGRVVRLRSCKPIWLGPGIHRIESRPGLSGAVLGASLIPLGDKIPRRSGSGPNGRVKVVDRSPTRLDLQLDAQEDSLLVGGMPFHSGWEADGDNLRSYPVPLNTFSAWAVDAPTRSPVTLHFKPQRSYELAMALSIAVGAWCLWRATRRRRRRWGSP